MIQVVFKSEYQDEVSCVDAAVAGLQFVRDVPQTVTDEQAEILLQNPNFTRYDVPNRYTPPPPSTAPSPAANEPEESA